MFNTGDLGQWHPDGTLQHLGRVDDQVKVKVSTHDLEHDQVHHSHTDITGYVGLPSRTRWRSLSYGGKSIF